MGQARNRGTFEQRQAAAYEAVEANIEVRKKELEQMDDLERRQTEAMKHFVDSQLIPQMDRKYGHLMRADYSLVKLNNVANNA